MKNNRKTVKKTADFVPNFFTTIFSQRLNNSVHKRAITHRPLTSIFHTVNIQTSLPNVKESELKRSQIKLKIEFHERSYHYSG